MKADSSEKLKRINAALALRDIPDYDAAINQIQKAIDLDPEDVTSHLLLGTTYQDLENYKNAERSFQKAVELQPDLLEAQQSLGLVLVRQWKYQTAIPILKKIEKIDPTNLEITKALATAFEHTGNSSEAIAFLEKAITTHPGDLPIKKQLARLLSDEGNETRAIELLEKVVEIEPSAENYNLMGIQYADLKQYEKAQELFTVAIKSNSVLASAWSNFAHTFDNLDQPEKALEIIEQGLERIPDHLSLLSYKAYLLSRIGKFDDSLALYDCVIEKIKIENPRRLEYALFNKAKVYILQNRIEDLFIFTSRALIDNPQFFILLSKVCDYFSDNARYDLSLELLEKISPEDKFKHSSLVSTYYSTLINLGDNSKAQQFLVDIVSAKLTRGQRESLLDLIESTGIKFYQQHKIAESKLIFEQILNVYPGKPDSTNNLGFLYISQCNWDLALELLQNAEENGYKPIAILRANRGYVHLRQGKFLTAVETLLRSLQSASKEGEALLHVAFPWLDGFLNNEPDNFPTRFVKISTSSLANLATCYYYLGDVEKALKTAQKAINTNPDESTGYRISGCLYNLLGNTIQAIENWETALQKEISDKEAEVVSQWIKAVSEK